MKKVIGLLFLLLAQGAYSNQLDTADQYQNALEAKRVEGNSAKAITILEDVFKSLSKDHPLFDEIYKTYFELIKITPDSKLEDAINFATGYKDEYYCKMIGLVFLKSFHNDGTISRLFLADGRRTLEKGSYSIVKSGRWDYQLGTGYRDPITSEVWLESADSNHYDVRELRKHKKGRDKGKWSAHWAGGSFTRNYHTKGDVKEPIPMFMAVDYHAWGTPDLGYRINFKEGDSQEASSHESTFGTHRILLTSKRVVKKKKDSFTTRDYDGKRREFQDCYHVRTDIKFAGVQVRK